MNNNFKTLEFIENEKSDSKAFLRVFTKLHMFTRFIEKKKWPTQNDDIIDTTFFDEHIKLKKAKSIRNFKKNVETPFLDD